VDASIDATNSPLPGGGGVDEPFTTRPLFPLLGGRASGEACITPAYKLCGGDNRAPSASHVHDGTDMPSHGEQKRKRPSARTRSGWQRVADM